MGSGAKVELSQVAGQVVDADVVACAVKRTLQLGEEVLRLVRGHDAPHELARRVVDGLMQQELMPEGLLTLPAVRPEDRTRDVDVLGHSLTKRRAGHIGDHLGSHFPVWAMIIDMTACLSVFLLGPVRFTRTGAVRLCWRFLGSPPIQVSSATITPLHGSHQGVFMASRMRCIMNQTERGQTPYLRSISRAETPFLLWHISKVASTHMRSRSFVPCMIVPVIAENCFRR